MSTTIDDWRSGSPAFQVNAFSRNLGVVDQLRRFADGLAAAGVSLGGAELEQIDRVMVNSVPIGAPSSEAMPSAE